MPRSRSLDTTRSDSLSKMNTHNIFYVAPEFFKGCEVVIQGPQLHHIRKVLRKEVGRTIFLTDGQGNQYETEIQSVGKSLMKACVLQKKQMPRKFELDLTVGFAVVKGLRNDVIIEKGTELGVSRFLVFLSRYSVIKHLSEHRISRFRKIAKSAMVQSQQYYLPEILSAGSVEEIPQFDLGYDQILVADPGGEAGVLKGIRRILLLIGPEGGFADFEKGFLLKQGAKFVSLGPTRLRSETAAIAAISKILTVYGLI